MPQSTRTVKCCHCGVAWDWLIKPGNYKPRLCAQCSSTHKFCSKCEVPKPFSDWYPSRSRNDGKQVYCKDCCARREDYICGRCSTTFRRAKPNGKVQVHLCNECEITYKWCSRYSEIKIHSSFSPRKDNRTGLMSHCLERHRRHYATLDRRHRVARTHKISVSRLAGIARQQADKCGICGIDMSSTARGPQLDHCHITGKIREFLCHNCNLGLGNFQDSIHLLKAATDYLQKYC